MSGGRGNSRNGRCCSGKTNGVSLFDQAIAVRSYNLTVHRSS